MIGRFLGDAFGVLSSPFLKYCFVVWCSAADTHLKQLDRAVSGARFLTGAVFECDIAHSQSVAVLCMLYKIRCNQMTLFMVLYLGRTCQYGLHAVLCSHICILIRFLAEEPRSTPRPLFLFQCPCGTILLTLYSMVWNWRVSRAGPMLFYWHKPLYSFLSSTIFRLSVYQLVLWGRGLWTECISLSRSLVLQPLLIIITYTYNPSTTPLG